MLSYIIRRLLLIVPTLLGIMLINFLLIQAAPGGPVDRFMMQLQGIGDATLASLSGGASMDQGEAVSTNEEISAHVLELVRARYGLDEPLHKRFITMMRQYLFFDFGDSFFRGQSVVSVVLEKMPVSISLGLWSTLFIYLISIPLGIRKAVKDGTPFDTYSSFILIALSAIPALLLAILLLVFFAGGEYFNWFPNRGLTSENFELLSFWGKIKDYVWHMALPVISITIGGFVGLTMLTKNSFLDQIRQQYVQTARAKGCSEARVMYAHVFRNAMLIVISGFPALLVGILFTGSLLIEIIFSLDGLGRLGFESIVKRDYPLIYGTLYFSTLLGLLLKLLTDLSYVLIDPRIDFDKREL